MAFGSSNLRLNDETPTLDKRVPRPGDNRLVGDVDTSFVNNSFDRRAVQSGNPRRFCSNVGPNQKPVPTSIFDSVVSAETRSTFASEFNYTDRVEAVKQAGEKNRDFFKLNGAARESIAPARSQTRVSGTNVNDNLNTFGKGTIIISRSDEPGSQFMQNQTSGFLSTNANSNSSISGDVSAPKFVKVLPKNMTVRGYKWRKGINFLDKKFDDNATHSCTPGGLYFTDMQGISPFLTKDTDVWEVCLPSSAQFVEDPGILRKWRSDKVILIRKWDEVEFRSKFSKEINLPKFKIPNLQLECPEIGFELNDLIGSVEVGTDFDVAFNEEFFDYGKDTIGLVNTFATEIDKWYKPDKMNFSGEVIDSLNKLKANPPSNIKGKALETLRAIDPENDLAKFKLDNFAIPCADGVQIPADNFKDGLGKLKVGVQKLPNQAKQAKENAFKKFGY